MRVQWSSPMISILHPHPHPRFPSRISQASPTTVSHGDIYSCHPVSSRPNPAALGKAAVAHPAGDGFLVFHLGDFGEATRRSHKKTNGDKGAQARKGKGTGVQTGSRWTEMTAGRERRRGQGWGDRERLAIRRENRPEGHQKRRCRLSFSIRTRSVFGEACRVH